jgi:acyl-CoA thioesterase-1
LGWLALLSLLACAQYARAAPEAKRTIVFLGDSITAGFGVDLADAYPSLIQTNLTAAGLPYQAVNAGVSGDTTADGLRRMDWLLRRPIDILFVALGGNDGLRGIAPDVTRKNLQGIIDKARKRYPNVEIVVAGMQMPPNMGEDYLRDFRAVFPGVASANHAELVPFLLADVGGVPEMNQPDHIHPSPAGHKKVAANVWKTLLPLLKKE